MNDIEKLLGNMKDVKNNIISDDREKLTSEQIDELLKCLASGEVDAEELPERFYKENLFNDKVGLLKKVVRESNEEVFVNTNLDKLMNEMCNFDGVSETMDNIEKEREVLKRGLFMKS